MGSEGTKHCRVKTKVEIREVCPKLNNKTQLDDVPPIVDDSVFYKTLCIIEISLSPAINEGSVPMGENEEMQILEQDQGDGWTRVRKNDGAEGFVPTSYIECHYYDGDQV